MSETYSTASGISVSVSPPGPQVARTVTLSLPISARLSTDQARELRDLLNGLDALWVPMKEEPPRAGRPVLIQLRGGAYPLRATLCWTGDAECFYCETGERFTPEAVEAWMPVPEIKR